MPKLLSWMGEQCLEKRIEILGKLFNIIKILLDAFTAMLKVWDFFLQMQYLAFSVVF